MECEKFFKLSKPLYKIIVLSAMFPPVANSSYVNWSKICLTSCWFLFVKKRVQCPLRSSPTLKELGLKEDSSSVPKAVAKTLFLPMRNLESSSASLSALKLLVVILSKVRT